MKRHINDISTCEKRKKRDDSVLIHERKKQRRKKDPERLNVKTLSDLISILKDRSKFKFTGVVRMQRLIPLLYKLDKIIGQEKLKNELVSLFIYLMGPMAKKDKMLNFCFFASPGMGKTTISKILAEAFVLLGILPRTDENKKQPYQMGTRTNMIAKYLGQSARLTQDLIDQCIENGQVLLCDEIYALGHKKKDDIYSKEVIDTLNQNMSEHAGKLIVIICGYKQEVRECFFASNPGLERRFNYVFELEPYSALDLRNILLSKVEEREMKIENNNTVNVEWFEKNKKVFKFAGGDVNALVGKAVVASSMRVFCTQKFGEVNIKEDTLIQEDFETALQQLKVGRAMGNSDESDENDEVWKRMFL